MSKTAGAASYIEYGGGAYFIGSHCKPEFVNCILWGDYPEEIHDNRSNYPSPKIAYSGVESGWSGTGSMDENPRFAAPYGGDFN